MEEIKGSCYSIREINMSEEEAKNFSIVEWLAKGKPDIWIKKYDKDGISIYANMFKDGVKLSIGEDVSQDEKIAVLNGIVAFSDWFCRFREKGSKPFVPYTYSGRSF